MKYQIEITEVLNRVVEIEAENIDKAIEKAKEQYNNEEIVLDSEDYLDTGFSEYIE